MSRELTGRWGDVFQRLRNDRAMIVSLLALAAVALLALFGPLVSPYAYDAIDLDNIGRPPSLHDAHFFGTDSLGRDLFVRTLIGTRISLLIGIVATLVSMIVGVVYGAVAGYLGGRVDNAMMRFVDVMYALPFMFFFILLMTLFENALVLLLIAIGAVQWLTMARIVRGQTLSIRQKEFIEAAIASGSSTGSIIRQHVIPNAAGPLIAYATLTIPEVILIESFLSFLGLGVREPLTSLGRLIADGAAHLETRPWALLLPGGFLVIMLFCFNAIGDGIRDALDPKER